MIDAARFSGEPAAASFSSWCDVPSGWQERCSVSLAASSDQGHASLAARLDRGDPITLLVRDAPIELRYLDDPRAGGRWFTNWGAGITAPRDRGDLRRGDADRPDRGPRMIRTVSCASRLRAARGWVIVGVAAISLAGSLAARESVATAQNRADHLRAAWRAEASEIARAAIAGGLADGEHAALAWNGLDSVIVRSDLLAGAACTVTARPAGQRSMSTTRTPSSCSVSSSRRRAPG